MQLDAEDQREDATDQPAGAPAALPCEEARERAGDARQHEDVHARRLRVFDHVRQQCDRRCKSDIPLRPQEAPARHVTQIDRRNARQRRRQAQCPFGLAEDAHRSGHEIQLAQAARIEHAARQDRPAVLHDVHRGHRHRLLVAVQAGAAEIPEANERADAQHDAEQRPMQHGLFRRGHRHAEQACERAHELGNRGVNQRGYRRRGPGRGIGHGLINPGERRKFDEQDMYHSSCVPFTGSCARGTYAHRLRVVRQRRSRTETM